VLDDDVGAGGDEQRREVERTGRWRERFRERLGRRRTQVTAVDGPDLRWLAEGGRPAGEGPGVAGREQVQRGGVRLAGPGEGGPEGSPGVVLGEDDGAPVVGQEGGPAGQGARRAVGVEVLAGQRPQLERQEPRSALRVEGDRGGAQDFLDLAARRP
jgi:hypothetical protein